MCLCQVNEESNVNPRTLTEITSRICMLFRNRGGCSDIPDFREITNEDVFAGANIMFQGWPYSYRAVKSTFRWSAAMAQG